MTSIEIVRGAKELLQNEESWWKGFAAVDESKAPVHQRSHRAQRFCLMGALHKIATEGSPTTPFVYQDALFAVYRFIPRDLERGVVSMSAFNDSPQTTHAMILEVLDKAITLLESKEKMCIS